MADLARITDIITPEAEALGLEVVRVKMLPSEADDESKALQIMAEDPATGQMVIEQCVALSRRISARFDEMEEAGDDVIDHAYQLEVSSPGIDRPLTRPQDFANWAGFEAKISLAEKVDGHRNLRGNLVKLDGDRVVIDDRKAGPVSVPLQAIHAAKLILTDELIAATGTLDSSGAEEIITTSSDQDGAANDPDPDIAYEEKANN